MLPFVREPTPADQAYLASTWLRSMRTTKDQRGRVPAEFFSEWAPVVDRILDRRDTRCLIAEADGRVLGWIVWTPIPGAPVLHYVYVRKERRCEGIGNQLARAAGFHRDAMIVYTCLGPCYRWLRDLVIPLKPHHITARRFLGEP